MKVQGIDGAVQPLPQVQAKSMPAGTLPEKEKEAAAGAGRLGAAPKTERAGGEAEPAKKKEEADKKLLEEAVEKANRTMETYNTELQFVMHEESGELMVKVIDSRDGSVIREIPPEYVLRLVAHIKKMLGIIIDKFI